jgi:hypothetical protein
MISNTTDLPAPEIGQFREWPKLRADRWLSLAAAPIFAVMALLTVVSGGGPVDTMCSVAGASPLGGMVPMYLLMSALHLTPWLKLISNWRSGTCRS